MTQLHIRRSKYRGARNKLICLLFNVQQYLVCDKKMYLFVQSGLSISIYLKFCRVHIFIHVVQTYIPGYVLFLLFPVSVLLRYILAGIPWHDTYIMFPCLSQRSKRYLHYWTPCGEVVFAGISFGWRTGPDTEFSVCQRSTGKRLNVKTHTKLVEGTDNRQGRNPLVYTMCHHVRLTIRISRKAFVSAGRARFWHNWSDMPTIIKSGCVGQFASPCMRFTDKFLLQVQIVSPDRPDSLLPGTIVFVLFYFSIPFFIIALLSSPPLQS